MSAGLQKLIVILGPTASGKTSLSLELAKKHHGYIISADSRQIYREMNIATAKVTAVEQAQIPHFLIDITNPDQPVALNQFQKQVIQIIADRAKSHPNQIPFLVGGTGLYIQSVIDNWTLPSGKPQPIQRVSWEQLPLEELAKKLLNLDPQARQFVDLKNRRRVIRALEILEKNRTLSPVLHQHGPALFDLTLIGMSVPKPILDERINQRVDQQIKDGLVEEVKALAEKYSWDLPSMSGIGYQEIGAYLQGKIDLPQAIELIKLHTRQYARRQMTWFKRDKRIHWITTAEQADQLLANSLLK